MPCGLSAATLATLPMYWLRDFACASQRVPAHACALTSPLVPPARVSSFCNTLCTLLLSVGQCHAQRPVFLQCPLHLDHAASCRLRALRPLPFSSPIMCHQQIKSCSLLHQALSHGLVSPAIIAAGKSAACVVSHPFITVQGCQPSQLPRKYLCRVLASETSC